MTDTTAAAPMPPELQRLRLDSLLHAELISALRSARDSDAARAAGEAKLMVQVSAELHERALALSQPSATNRQQVAALASLTSDLSDYARARAGTLVLEREPLHLSHWLAQFANERALAAQDEHSSLSIDIGPSAPERVMADPARLAKLLAFWLDESMVTIGAGPTTLKVSAIDPQQDPATGPSVHRRVQFTVRGSTVARADSLERPECGTRREAPATWHLRACLAQDLRELTEATITAHCLVVPLEIAPDQAHTGYSRLLSDFPASAAAAPRTTLLMQDSEAAIDFVHLDRQLGSLAPYILARTAPAFIAQAGARLTDLYVARDLKNPARLRVLAHAWRGSAMTVGARHLATLLDAVDKQTAAGSPPPDGQIIQLGDACDQLVRALESYLLRQPVASPTPRCKSAQRILLVEPESDQTIYWDIVLSSLGFEVVAASSIVEANALLADAPRIVVCSSQFADGRGVDFVKALRERPEFALTYLILLTSSVGREDVIESLHSGANDSVDKDATYGEIRARFELAERVIALNDALHRKSSELSEALGVIQTELQSAARLQVAILPAPIDHRGVQIRTVYVPSDTLGGDMLGADLVDDDRIAFGLIDVAGHGTASALISCSLMRELMDRMTRLLQDARGKLEEPCVQLAIAQMNQHYCRLNLPGFYFTALAGVLDLGRGTVSYCQAGHPSLLSFDAVRGWIELEHTGFPVGLLEDASYLQRRISLEPGQVLLAISDGFLRPDSADPSGTQALLQALRRTPPNSAAIIAQLNALASQAQGPERDDQSALLIHFAAPMRQPTLP